MKKRFNSLSGHQIILRIILNLWTVLAITLFVIDFFSGNKFDSSACAIGVIYLAILGIYATDKEYSRWKTKFASRFIGESFVIIWTIVMIALVIIAPLSNGAYRIPTEFTVVYTSVIGIFAITQHSKALHQKLWKK